MRRLVLEQPQSRAAIWSTRMALFAIVAQPFIPDAAAAMMKALACDDWSWPDDPAAALQTLPAGHAYAVPDNLFRKITDEERADWQVRFAGIRA